MCQEVDKYDFTRISIYNFILLLIALIIKIVSFCFNSTQMLSFCQNDF